MVQPVADRVKDATTTTGTGNITLSNTAPAGYQTFLAGFGSSTSKQICYCISNPNSPYEWEVGQGIYTSSTNTIIRGSVLSNSAGTQPTKIAFPAGTKDVFCTTPSASLLVQDNAGVIEIPNTRNGASSYIRNQINSSGRVQGALGFICYTPTLAGEPGTNINIEAGNSSTTNDAGTVIINSGNAPGIGRGGDASFAAGNSSAGDSGVVTISAGSATGAGLGGDILLLAGGSGTGAGGIIDLNGGDGGTSGGYISITAGGVSSSYAGNGGDITIESGVALGSGSNGSITISLAGISAIVIQPANATTTSPVKIGFFGATPVVKPTGVAVTAAAIHAALVSLGLIAA